MRLLLASEEDVAGVNIRDRLMESSDWQKVSEFAGRVVLRDGSNLLASMPQPHLFADNVDQNFTSETGFEISELVFLSRHRAASGIPTLTVHPIGNYGKADFGGREGQLVPSAPSLMTALLRQLKVEAEGLPFQVSFEVTHHGPWLTTPTVFIEIGSDERNWGNVEAARAIAHSLLNAIPDDSPNAIGIGGGHYAPRFSEVCISNRINFGHMVPNHAIENSTPGMIEATLVRAKAASNASLAYIHRKSMSGPKAREIKEICERIGLRPVDSSDLQSR